MMCSRTTVCRAVVAFCTGIAPGQTVRGVVGVKVILGKQPAASAVLLNPSPTGEITGQVEGKVPPGTRFVLLDAQGGVVASAPVNAADGTFQLPPPRVPFREDFTSCLEAPGAARKCSEAGAMAAVSSTRQTPKRDFGDRVVGAQLNPAAPIPAAEAAVLSGIQINRMPNGSWRCAGKTGACSPTEAQAMGRLAAREQATGGMKDTLKTHVLVIAPDGTVGCRDSATGRPCTDAEAGSFAAALKTRHDTVKNSINNVR